MSAAPGMDGVTQALWAAGEAAEAYAVLDGARDERIAMLVKLWELEHACLYGDAASTQLRDVAPYLVRLEHGRAAARSVLQTAWDGQWGIFAAAPAGTGMRAVARHLRRLLRVLDERGKVLLFRFYDPRVLRAFVPTCDAAQRAELFGPLTRFVVPGDWPGPIVFEGGPKAAALAAADRG